MTSDSCIFPNTEKHKNDYLICSLSQAVIFSQGVCWTACISYPPKFMYILAPPYLFSSCLLRATKWLSPELLSSVKTLRWRGGKEPPWQCRRHRDTGLIPGLGRSPRRGNGNLHPYSWKIPWTEEPGGLQSMGLQRVRHD